MSETAEINVGAVTKLPVRNASSSNTIGQVEDPAWTSSRRNNRRNHAHTLCVNNVTYTVHQRLGSWWKGACFRRKVSQEVLRRVTFTQTSGQLAGILGSSGSGKTSLLDVISCRGTGHVTGEVKLNGHYMSEEYFRGHASYMTQDDRLLACLTVNETLSYTYRLRYAGLAEKHDYKDKVDAVISEMGLRQVADSRIGGDIVRGISGGERRRVSIAVQLLQDPDTLLLDEPTTGLDSFTAHALVRTLAELARCHNKVILMTLHQPSSDLFPLIDTIGLLSAGRFVYYGPRHQLIPYFSNINFPCPVYSNPFDYYVDVSAVDRRSKQSEDSSQIKVKDLHTAFDESSISKDMAIEGRNVTRAINNGGARNDKDDSFSAGVTRFSLLLRRSFLGIFRDRTALVVRSFCMPAFSFFIWIYCWQLPMDFGTGVQDRTGIFYQTVTMTAQVGVINCGAMFPEFRNLYYIESKDGLYGPTPFLISYFIHIVPFHLVSSLGFSLWVYWGVGLYGTIGSFMLYFLVVVFQQYLGELLTIFLLRLFRDTAVAQSCGTMVVTSAVLFSSGLFRSYENMLPFWEWISYLSFFKYSTEILVANEYGNVNFTCPEYPDCGGIPGTAYLDMLYPEADERILQNFMILIAFVVAFWFVCVISYKTKLTGCKTTQVE